MCPLESGLLTQHSLSEIHLSYCLHQQFVPLHCQAAPHSMDVPQSVHSPFEVHLGFAQVWVNYKAAMNICVQVSSMKIT